MNKRLYVGLIALIAAAAGCGSDSGTKHAASGEGTITITMKDTAFSPTSLTVKANEVVRFRFKNTGVVDHEAIIGDEQLQRQHEQDMINGRSKQGHDGAMTGDDTAHGDSGTEALTVKPGKSGDLTHTFKASENGTIIGCHEPRHYSAGMKIKVTVEA